MIPNVIIIMTIVTPGPFVAKCEECLNINVAPGIAVIRIYVPVLCVRCKQEQSTEVGHSYVHNYYVLPITIIGINFLFALLFQLHVMHHRGNRN